MLHSPLFWSELVSTELVSTQGNSETLPASLHGLLKQLEENLVLSLVPRLEHLALFL